MNFKDGRTLKKYYCKICGKRLSSYTAKICLKCLIKFCKNENNHNYKTGKYCIPRYCQDCGKQLTKKNSTSKRCRKCADIEHSKFMKDRFIGIKNFNFKHGKSKNKYATFRRKIDIEFKILHVLRTRVNRAIKHQKKSRTTMKLTGCSIKELKKHLENQFKKGMNWSNYGYYGWHIDHIRPCCSFDLSKASEQRKCFNYKNLQPLWAEENMKKHAKYLKNIQKKMK